MHYLSKEVIKNKRVLLRCDYNVSIENGEIVDDIKIKKSLETIDFLLNNDNTVIIMSHIGRIKKM